MFKHFFKWLFNKPVENFFICDCSFWQIPNIKSGHQYVNKKEFKEFNSDERYGFDPSVTYLYDYIHEKYFEIGKYYRRACLSCGKCLNEYDLLIEKFQTGIKYFESLDKIEEQKIFVDKVCEGNK